MVTVAGAKTPKQFLPLGSHFRVIVFQVTREDVTPDPLKYVDLHPVRKGQSLLHTGELAEYSVSGSW